MDTQWPIFEVFHQATRGEPHVHVGAVHAPDGDTAHAIIATQYEDADLFEHGTDKSYREAFGYETTKRAKAVGDAGDI